MLTLAQHKKQYSHNVISGFHGGGYKDYDLTGCDNVRPFSLVDTEHNTSSSGSTRHSELKVVVYESFFKPDATGLLKVYVAGRGVVLLLFVSVIL